MLLTRFVRPTSKPLVLRRLFSTTPLSTLWNPTSEHAALRETLRSFVAQEVEPQARTFNAQEQFNVSLFRKLANLGLLGLTVPEIEYGGTGWTEYTATAVCAVHEELSYSDPAFCLSYLAHSLLFVNNLSVNASPEQKARFLPPACDGRHIGGMCMSEPQAGTDVLGMQTKAVPDGEHHWRLTGTKLWITNGTLNGQDTGDLFLVYARTGPGKTDLTQFIVEKGMEGFRLGQKINNKLGMRASMTAELIFDQVPIPNENIVGKVHGATLCMMRNLEIERLGLAAMSVGIARRCIDEMKAYALERTAFGAKNLFAFGQIQRMVAESYAEYMAGRSYVYAVANALDLSTHGNGLDADGTKLFCAPMAKTVADRAIQVMGGNGYTGEYNVERLWRDAKLMEIGGGTNESHRKNMSRDLRKMGSTRLD
ncbi:isovaleryl-CoA dehydrogenase [Fistulifera solaris]|uniref:Isovaleryl-CoA dehydrogenase n=1 Tax=Fistulifera solaris TaxID=1519565 RepID=A0A1Z5KJC0_FISSO|nr:isovaleryl-CoA dehydrogenase [Fistulifera solaris]|eukprot:GAX26346.1 isovaleryl-CoA dehydrogenase [Fistulifera solaris]